MKTLNRYILSELKPPFLFGFAVFTFILLMDTIFQVLELIISRGVAVGKTLLLLLYSMPATVAITVPMAALLAVLMAFGRLSKDNEITALRASGISFKRIIVPVILFGFGLSVFMVFFNDLVLPYGNYAYKKLYVDIIRKKAEVVIQPGRFIREFDNYILYVEKVDRKSGELGGILIFQASPGAPLRTIRAKSGKLVSDPKAGLVSFLLYDGQLQSINPLKPETFLQATFSSHSLSLDINSILRSTRGVHKSAREMTIREIMTYLKKHQGIAKNNRSFRVEFHKKISIPFACLAFVLIGAPLGIFSKRSGKGAGFGISVILIFVYYMFLIGGQVLGENGALPPLLAMWLPNLVLGGLGGLLIYITSQEIEIHISDYPPSGLNKFLPGARGK